MTLADRYIARIKRALTGDLLQSKYKWMHDPKNPTAGHCYHAAEALWHLLGGADTNWVPMRVREDDGMTHWWLRNRKTGVIADPTADQYRSIGEEPPYQAGRAGGFLTSAPSKRAAEIIRRLTVTKSFKRTSVFLDNQSQAC